MIITLYLNDRLINFRLPTSISGSFSFDYEKKENNLINIDADDGKWFLYAIEDMVIYHNQQQIKRVVLEPNEYYVIKREEKLFLIYISDPNQQKVYSYSYNSNFKLIVGNSTDANLYKTCPYFKELLFEINYNNKDLQIINKGKSNIYLNKKAIIKQSALIKMGDEVDIYGMRLIFLKSFFLIINNAKKEEFIKNNNLIKHSYAAEELPKNIDIKDNDLYKSSDYYSKAPRIRRTIEPKTVKISPPPNEEKNELPLILVIGPMLTMGVTGAAMLISTVSSLAKKTVTLAETWPQLVMSGAMLVSMLVWPLVTQFYNRHLKKKRQKEIITKYNEYLTKKDKFFADEMELQKVILLENLLTIEDCIGTIANKNMNFWDKRLDQNDLLTLRLGVGNQPLDIKVEYNEEDFKIDENELRQKAEDLISKYKYIPNVPIGYSFNEHNVTAIMGNSSKTKAFVHNLILQIITFYTYEDVKIVLFTNEQNINSWEYLKYLNHNFNDEKSIRFFSTNKENAKTVADYLSSELNNRLPQASNKNYTPKPYYFIIMDEVDEIKHFDFIKDITELDKNLGFSIIFIENKLSKLPSKCNNFITIGEKKSEILINAYEKQEKISFIDEIHYNIDMNNIVKILANIPIEFENNISHLPSSINFLEMEQVGKVEQLNILNRWQRNDATLSLKAEVGVDEQGDLLYLDLHEKFHGPHGLIAGTTGSGKSEFIITYILSLAINYSPEEVSFILIDYKGGGLAYAFENKTTNLILPHLAGTITNLDKSEIDRALVSINSEIKRRQQIFNEARDKLSESTIDIYKYQRYYNEGRLDEPISHLFIICDEFAELKVNQPDFMDDLISVARIGRSLGVHLILATQKPSGVVNDQIWSNTRFRVCLKVSDEQDSREMLKRPEAAAIKQTGRFYLQVGYDEYFVLGQSAYAGANYYPSEKLIKQVDRSINFIDNSGTFIKNIQSATQKLIKSEGEQITAILKDIIEVSESLGMKAKKLWLESLPEEEIVSSLEKKYNIQKSADDVKIIIGEYDAPQYQSQNIVTYSYLNNGNTIIYGNDGSENENLLNTIIYETARNYPANIVNFYIIDYGSESLVKYSKLPHVGGLVLALEEEKYHNLWKLIKEDITKRKKILSEYNGDFKLYNAKNSTKLPIKVIIMNNYDSIYEANANLYDELPELIRDSERYGIIFIITANQVNSVHTKISQNCPNIIAYKLKEENDYRAIYDVHTKIIPKNIFGRGLIRLDEVYEFQTASPFDSNTNITNQITDFVKNQQNINQNKANKIPTLPDIIRLKDIESNLNDVTTLPIAISKNELEILSLDFSNNLGNIITSNKISNLKNFILSLIEEISYLKNTQLIIIDSANDLGLNKIKYPNYYTDNYNQLMDSIIEYLKNLINQKSTLKGIIIIYSLDKFISKVDPDKINELFNLLKTYEKIYPVIADAANKIKNYTYEQWFTGIFSLNDGLWIGKGITDQTLFHLSNITRDMTKEYNNQMGYIITESSPTLCKLIDFISKEEE